ncbi:MAG: acetyl-CoA carboxylase biotin carboxyl carrier protein subunit [Acidobacteriota bacterium]
MIVEVSIGDERPRRYQVRRRGEQMVVHRLEDTDDNGARPIEEKLIDWRRPQPGIYSLLIDNRSYEVFVDEQPDGLDVHLVKRTFRIRAADVRSHRRASDAGGAVDGVVRITAPIPGRVSRVLVEPGQQVARGDGVIVVEAMKMENELRAPRDGVISAVEVVEGQGVEGGALLATIE